MRWRLCPSLPSVKANRAASSSHARSSCRTPEEWKALWKEHAPGQPMPAVDFTKSIVIGVFLGRGTPPSIGHITGIERDGTGAAVTYREERPGARDILAQVITFPHHLVRFERIAGEVKFARAEWLSVTRLRRPRAFTGEPGEIQEECLKTKYLPNLLLLLWNAPASRLRWRSCRPSWAPVERESGQKAPTGTASRYSRSLRATSPPTPRCGARSCFTIGQVTWISTIQRK